MVVIGCMAASRHISKRRVAICKLRTTRRVNAISQSAGAVADGHRVAEHCSANVSYWDRPALLLCSLACRWPDAAGRNLAF